MKSFTLRGSEALDTTIRRHLQQIVEAVAPHCESIILIGGYGRGEGTPFIHPDGSQSPFNDYDLVVIVSRLDAAVRQTFRALEHRLSDEVGLPVDLCPYRRDQLPHCEFSLLNYEMKHGHTVLWGDAHTLAAMPAYPQDAIPLSEGSRLLLNRGKLLLDVKRRLADPAPLTDEERIRFLKFMSKVWLAIGDAALLCERKYDIHYEVKLRRIETLGELPHRVQVIAGYREAVELRDWGDYPSRLAGIDIPEEFQRVRSVFLDCFEWCRKQHSKKECPAVKAMLLNLKWNHWPYLKHPRIRLYDALPELLQDHPDKILLGQMLACSDQFENRFYELRARFS